MSRYNPAADDYKGQYIHKGRAKRIEAALAKPDNTAKLYEELRSIIDGGSESFTHEDAVQYLKDSLRQKEWTPENTAYRPGGLSLTDWEAIAADQAMTIVMMEIEQEPGIALRATFEEWAKTFNCSFKTIPHPPYDYCNRDVQFIWKSWQASRLTDADRKSYQLGYNAGVKHQKQRAKREWVGLTDEELAILWLAFHGCCLADGRNVAYEKAIEAALKEMNT